MLNTHTLDTSAVLAILHNLRADIDRLEAMVAPVESDDRYDLAKLDPSSPVNKSDKFLSLRGIEVCYRLFDMGKSRYEVAQLMNISFSAADNHFKNWEGLGGTNRKMELLEGESA